LHFINGFILTFKALIFSLRIVRTSRVDIYALSEISWTAFRVIDENTKLYAHQLIIIIIIIIIEAHINNESVGHH